MMVNFFEFQEKLVIILEVNLLAKKKTRVSKPVVLSNGKLLLMGELIPHVLDFK